MLLVPKAHIVYSGRFAPHADASAFVVLYVFGTNKTYFLMGEKN